MKEVGYTRRDFLRTAGLCTASLVVPGCAGRAQQNPPKASKGKPNFIIIFTDDQGYQDVGCFGSPNINTPNLDRMADEGAKFTDFYSAASVCSPSRAALLTGCYPPRVSITKVLFPRDKIGLNPDEVTIADVLKAQGYATACVGKWHLGHLPQFLPTSNGFDSYFGIPYSNDMDGVKGKNRNLDRAWKEKDYSPWNVPLMRDEKIIERPADQTTLIERYTQEAVRFINENKDRPFFLYLPHTMPHIPLFVSDEFFVPDAHKAYKATIEQIDSSVGRILETLKKAGVDKNTLVVFTSDNGPWLGKKHHGGSALPLRDGKFTTYEGGMREPTIMRWPGKIPADHVCGEICGTIDLLPTLARLAGAEVPADRVIDGKDIWPLMLGKPGAKSPHKAYFYYKGKNLEAVRGGKWKLRQTKKTELYDLQDDISEKNNVAADYPGIVERLNFIMKEFDTELKANVRPPGKAV
ncbi:MAG: sulfatase-like hydrolase/transferase [Phycisphaerae bacterium]|nr:sulfatase [Phycisphaerae bacterium]NIP54280.1 sulfatase [Phycisphaerae bacterium]NIS53149.1 sulfatase [Phycisphaerae bacterium]NIU10634.1 sulfatase [Phycisphaerae bacterium]NIU58395.1 sulfatase-like hydrolase/transferase [Phycisphaerae bacterium]